MIILPNDKQLPLLTLQPIKHTLIAKTSKGNLETN